MNEVKRGDVFFALATKMASKSLTHPSHNTKVSIPQLMVNSSLIGNKSNTDLNKHMVIND